MAEELKGIKIDKLRKLEQWKKNLDQWFASDGEYFEDERSLNM